MLVHYLVPLCQSFCVSQDLFPGPSASKWSRLLVQHADSWAPRRAWFWRFLEEQNKQWFWRSPKFESHWSCWWGSQVNRWLQCRMVSYNGRFGKSLWRKPGLIWELKHTKKVSRRSRKERRDSSWRTNVHKGPAVREVALLEKSILKYFSVTRVWNSAKRPERWAGHKKPYWSSQGVWTLFYR